MTALFQMFSKGLKVSVKLIIIRDASAKHAVAEHQVSMYTNNFGKKNGSKTLAETYFCHFGRNPSRNLFLPGRFIPVLAETCQPFYKQDSTQSNN